MVNRAFTEPRAPGSTFKMITAVAALEKGIVTPKSTVYDEGVFTKASTPYARCYAGGGHGHLNAASALEVSCNYYFYEVSYRMGNSRDGNRLAGIEALNEWMTAFGLNDPTGVEIYELYNSTREGVSNISSPNLKDFLVGRNPAAPQSDRRWADGDTIRTAIGQSLNNYTAATMAKYFATLATGGTRYKLHLFEKTADQSGETVKIYEPAEEAVVSISEANLQAVYEGMLAVIKGSRGTARQVFSDFPVQIAGKTGTAQQFANKPDHTSFGCFAPYDEPRIAVYVHLPFGTTAAYPNAAAQVAKAVMTEYFKLGQEPQRPAGLNSLTE